MTKVLEFEFSIIFSPMDDCIDSEYGTHSIDDVKKVIAEKLNKVIDEEMPNGYGCTFLGKYELKKAEEL